VTGSYLLLFALLTAHLLAYCIYISLLHIH